MTGTDELDRYIDRLFGSVARTKKTRKLKAQISESAREKYEALLGEGIGEAEACVRVVADIGTEEELRREYPPRNPALYVFAAVFLVLFAAGIVFFVYCAINTAQWRRYYLIMSLWIASVFVKPALFLTGSYLALFLGGKLFPALGRLAFQKKAVRAPLLAAALVSVCFYYFVMANSFLGFVPVNPVFFWMNLHLSYLNGPLFILPGILLYCGIKK